MEFILWLGDTIKYNLYLSPKGDINYLFLEEGLATLLINPKKICFSILIFFLSTKFTNKKNIWKLN